jgi:hypothetical protein
MNRWALAYIVAVIVVLAPLIWWLVFAPCAWHRRTDSLAEMPVRCSR